MERFRPVWRLNTRQAGLLVLLVISVFLWPRHGLAQLYDPRGCEALLRPLHQPAELVVMGVSPDGVDFIARWKVDGLDGLVETHTPLAPPSQWSNPAIPEPLPVPPTSYHLDRDGDGFYEHIFVGVAPTSGCERMIHFQWMNGRYVIVVSGKETN